MFEPGMWKQWCRLMLSIGGDNLQFYPNVAQFSTLGGMKLGHYFFHVSKSSEDQKKRGLHRKLMSMCPRNQVKTKTKKGLHRKLRSFCPQNQVKTKKSPKIIQSLDADHSQIIAADADAHHSQIIGGSSQTVRGIYPPIPTRFRHPCLEGEAEAVNFLWKRKHFDE